MQNSMYYSNSGLASLPEYQGGGYIDQYGRQRYGFGKLVRSITKPIAKVLDKIVPNEIKPALPYLAAIAPFTGIFGTLAGSMPGFGLTGPALDFAQRGLLGAAVNAGSQLSQEGAADRGLNLPSLGLSAISAGLSGGTAGQFLEGFRPTVGGEANLGTFDTLLSKGISGLQKGAEVLNTGREADLFSTDFAKAAATPLIGAAGEQAYNAALDANKKYQEELLAMGNLASAGKQDQINFIRKAMVSAGFNEDEISSAITRSGFAGGGEAQDGLMNLKMGGMPVEMDLRAKGGFVPIGRKERADDVPARLSKNEFVFTAKAVKNAGGGDVRKGAKRMYQIMNQLEART
jgi:alkylhydroperoxidase/carboxymuconolactone decarboxylase family protein YurZ